jgi:hypothetical protein
LVASGLPAQATPLLGREREAAMLAARGLATGGLPRRW